MHPIRQGGAIVRGKEVSATHDVLMAELERALTATTAAQRDQAMGQLRDTLPHHFALEEDQGGLFDWLIALLPGRRDDVELLIVQHADLLTAVAVLDAATLPAFADLLRRHERKEHALHQEALAAARS